MSKLQLHTTCEGPLALNDNAFELCRDVIKPQGDRVFRQVSRYNDYLTAVAKTTGLQAGDILKFILPFLKAHGLTNAQIEAFCQNNLALMPGALDAFQFLHSRDYLIFAASTGCRQFAEAVGLKLGFQRNRILGTALDLDHYHLPASEAEALRRLQDEIATAPEIELPAEVTGLTDLPEPAQEAVATLDRIFGELLPAMEIGAILKEVHPVGGPEKAQAVTDSLAETGLKMSDVIYVGSGSTDVPAFEAVRAGGGLTLAFNGDRQAISAAEVVMVSDSAWSIALVTAIMQMWGKEGVLEVAAPERRDKSRNLVLPEDAIDPIFSGLDGHMLNVYLSKGSDRDKLAKESQSMRAKLRGAAVAALG